MDTSRLIVQDVRIFDGITDRLSNGHVLVEGRTIAAGWHRSRTLFTHCNSPPEMRGRFDATAAGQQRIVALIETRIDEQDR